MNCRRGDLARFVPLLVGDEWARGRIVVCLQLLEGAAHQGSLPVWRVDPPLRHPDGQLCNFAFDLTLRPIGNPGAHERDESLAWTQAPRRDLIPLPVRHMGPRK